MAKDGSEVFDRVPEVHQLLAPWHSDDLLWPFFASKLPVPEATELRSIIGDSLISEVESLFRERIAHIEILSTYRTENDSRLSMRSVVGRTLESSHQKVEKEVLRSNILKAIDRIPLDLVPLSERDRSIVRLFRRTTTAGSDEDGPLLTGRSNVSCSSGSGESRPSSRASSASNDGVDAVRSSIRTHSNMNIDGIDGIVDSFRDALRQEAQNLREDIEYLVNCLEEEIARTAESDIDPSVKDLRELNSKLTEYEATEKLLGVVSSSKNTASKGLKPIPDRPPSATSLRQSSATSSRPSLTDRLRSQVEGARR
eukprot:ANDGO_01634.mRNA.1 hypothetical protein